MKPLFPSTTPSPRPSKRSRPEDLVYALDEVPPVGVTISLGVQHAALSLMFLLYALVAAQAIGLDKAATYGFVSATILLHGAATLLQALPSRVGAGMVLVAIPAPSRLPIFIAVVTAYGMGAAMGGAIVSGLAAIAFARVIPRMRAFFPPEVIGVVVVLLGLSLVTTGLTRGAGLTADGEVSAPALASSAVTVACIVAVSLWGPPALRRWAVIAGVAAGTMAARAVGVASGDGLEALAALPLVAVPILGLDLPAPEFLPVPVAVCVVAEVIGVVDMLGAVLSMDRMNDARWRRVDMALVARAASGQGIAHVAQGLAGVLASAVSSANLGLAHATGVTSWRVGAAAGAVLMATAFVPPLAGLVTLTPAPVVGGILIYTASYLIVAGMGLATSRMMNTQRSFTVGLALVCGTGVMLLPALARASPEWSRIVVGSGLTVGSMAAMALNAVLRIGVKQTAALTLGREGAARRAAEFLERNGRAWGARQDVVLRASVALGEALEAVRQSGVDGPVALSASFDEFNLRCRLSYPGADMPIGDGTAPDVVALLEAEGDDALDALMRKVSGALILRLADRVRSGRRDGMAELVFDFEH